MKKLRLLLITTLAGMLAACGTTQNSAPVVDYVPVVKARDTGKSNPNATSGAPKAQDTHGNYTVKKGDTLIRIALDYGQNYHDLVTWNNLANPNDIKVDQVLRVLPPEPGTKAQTASVAIPAINESKDPKTTQPASASPASATSASGGMNKNTPRGEKRAYSESVLAELQKPEASGTVSSAVAAVPAVTAPPAVTLVKSAPSVATVTPPMSTEDEGVSWIWPSEGKIIGSFDEGKNKGIDIAGKPGQHVLAAGAGKVMYAGSGIRGYGNLVIVKHSNNLLSAYAHNQVIHVKEGQAVNKGQMIAEMGNSDSDAVMLHFEIRQQGKPVDPSKFLPNRTQ